MKNKLIYVDGEDYAAVFFENWVEANKLSFEDVCVLSEIGDDEGYAEIQVLEFGEIDPKFIKFMYQVQDYETSKHENFYFKDNKIFNGKE